MKIYDLFAKVFCIFGLLHPGYTQALECYKSNITSPSPFMGNSGEVFKLSDGTVGEIVSEYEYLYEYYPSVTVCPDRSILVVNGKSLGIRLFSESTSNNNATSPDATSDYIESKIDDEFEGYDSGNIYKLRNGQLWEQISARYQYKYRYAPDVIIYRRDGVYRMQVEGMNESVTVERLK